MQSKLHKKNVTYVYNIYVLKRIFQRKDRLWGVQGFFGVFMFFERLTTFYKDPETRILTTLTRKMNLIQRCLNITDDCTITIHMFKITHMPF